MSDDQHDEKTIREGIRGAQRGGEHLRVDDTPSEPGRPEAVNLERDEPITDAARRRDRFEQGERVPERAVRAEGDARRQAQGEPEQAQVAERADEDVRLGD